MKDNSQPAKKNSIAGALSDLIILCLLLGAAGFGGYYWGIHQRLAPVEAVAPGTPGARPAGAGQGDLPVSVQADKPGVSPAPAKPTDKPPQPGRTAAGDAPATPPDKDKKKEQLKYWLSSSGADYTGYSITVKVNGTPVDNFFGPGKSVDVTRLVKHGDNTIAFEAKALGDQYNKHSGDGSFELTIKLVRGPYVQENFSGKDVLTSYSRTAAETEDFSDTRHFDGE